MQSNMIKPTTLDIPYLGFRFMCCQYLQKQRIFIRWDHDSEFVIYKFDASDKYVEYRICSQPESFQQLSQLLFIGSNQTCFLLGSGFKKKIFTIFIIDLQKKEIIHTKQIDMKQAKQYRKCHGQQTQIYKLEEDFKVIDFNQFPHVQEYTFARNVESFEFLHFQELSLLQLKRGVNNHYYVLPLTKTSRPVKYNEKMKRTLILKLRIIQDEIWNDRITQVSQVYFYYKQLMVGYYFNLAGVPFLFTKEFVVFFDSKDTLKICQIRPKAKILRSRRNINGIDNFIGSRILCRIHDYKIIYDLTTGQHFELEMCERYFIDGMKLHQAFLIEQDLIKLKLTYLIERQINS